MIRRWIGGKKEDNVAWIVRAYTGSSRSRRFRQWLKAFTWNKRR